MKARAHVRADAVGGRTRLTTLYAEPPFALRPTPGALHLAAAAGGPLQDDDLHLDIEVGEGAALVVRAVAATVALAGVSRLRTTVRLGAGAALDLRPGAVVVTVRADHRIEMDVAAARGSRLVLTERVRLGRHGEASGRLSTRTDLVVGGEPMLRHGYAFDAASVDAPGGVGPYRSVGTVVLLADTLPVPTAARDASGVRALAVLREAGAGPGLALGTALGLTPEPVDAFLDGLADGWAPPSR